MQMIALPTNMQQIWSWLKQKQPPRGVRKKRYCENMQHIYSRSVISIKLLCSLVNLLQIFRIRFPRIISGWLLLLILSCSNVPLLVATDNPMSTKCLMFSHNKQPKIKFLGIKLGSTLSVENHVKKGKSKATCTC